MNTTFRLAAFVAWTAVSAVALVHADDSQSMWQKAYPPAAKGMVRHVLHLPSLKEEDAAKVELIAGREMETDGVNRQSIGGSIRESVVEGWGYPRYDVTTGPVVSTLIGVDPNQPKVKKFVTVGGGPHLVRYNSKLPIVVYAPEGIEVRYRIWKAEPTVKNIDRG